MYTYIPTYIYIYILYNEEMDCHNAEVSHESYCSTTLLYKGTHDTDQTLPRAQTHQTGHQSRPMKTGTRTRIVWGFFFGTA